MHFTCRSFLGHSSASSWSQFWENEPDDNQISDSRGHLFGLVNLQFATPPTDLPLIGRQLIDSLTKAYFAASQSKISDRLCAAVTSVLADSTYNSASIGLCLAVIKGDQLFISTWGSVSASICRSGQLAVLLQGQGPGYQQTQGILHLADRLFWATNDFVDQLHWEDIKSYLADSNIQSLEENLLPRLYSVNQQSGLAAIAIDIHQSGQEQLVPPPPPLPTATAVSTQPTQVPPVKLNPKLPKFKLPKLRFPFIHRPVTVSEYDSTDSSSHRRINLIVATFLLIALLLSTFLGYRKNLALRAESRYQSLRSEVDKKLADATAIKNLNLDSAKDLASQAQSLLSQMQALGIHLSDLKPYQDQVTLLLSQTGSTPATTPDSFFDLSLIADNTKYSHLTLANQSIYLLDPVAGRVDAISITEKSNKNISTGDSLKSASFIVANNQQIYVVTDSNLFLLSKSQIDKKTTFSAPIRSLHFWNGAIYYLDASSLWKINPNSTDFGAPQKWLKDGQTLPSSAISFAINGQVWVLGADGTITPYSLGQKTIFKMSQALNVTGAHSLTVSPSADQLAFADAANNVYVIHKDGAVKARYNYGSQNILDLAISDSDHSLYVLTADQKIYKVGL